MAYPKSILAALTALIYLPTAFFGWVYLDDYLIVQESSFYAKLSNIVATFSRSVWLPTAGEYMYYRPISTSLYVLDAWFATLFTGEVDPWTFHVTNILLTSALIALTYAFFKNLKTPYKFALGACLVLMVHPASVATVAWVSGQNELLLAICVIGAFIALFKALTSSPKYFILYGFMFLAALLTKENAIALPPLTVLYLLTRAEHRRSLKTWGFVVASWIGAALIWFLLLSQGAKTGTPSLGSAIDSMLAGFPYMFIFLGRFLLPFELNVLPIARDTSPIVFGAGLLAGLLIFAVGLWQIRRRPLILFGFAWFIAFLLPTFGKMLPDEAQTFILRGDRSYLAAFGILVTASQVNWSRLDSRIVGAVLAVLLAMNLVHQFDYADGMRFYTSAVKGSPSLAFAHTHLGDMYLLKEDFPTAVSKYETALAIDDSELNAYNNLGVTYQRMGVRDKALLNYEKELVKHPNNILSLYNSGAILINRGDLDEAEPKMRKVVTLNPDHKDAWGALAQIYARQRDSEKFKDAKVNFEKAQTKLDKGI